MRLDRRDDERQAFGIVKGLFALLGMVAVVGLLVPRADAGNGRREDLLNLLRYLNGSPTKIGTIVSAAGASTTNASTSTPFTLTPGWVIDVVCDADVKCIEGSSASTTITNAAYGVPQASGKDRFWLLKGGIENTTLACAASGAFNCAVFRMD